LNSVFAHSTPPEVEISTTPTTNAQRRSLPGKVTEYLIVYDRSEHIRERKIPVRRPADKKKMNFSIQNDQISRRLRSIRPAILNLGLQNFPKWRRPEPQLSSRFSSRKSTFHAFRKLRRRAFSTEGPLYTSLGQRPRGRSLSRRIERAWLVGLGFNPGFPRRKAKQINVALASEGMPATCSELP
jgi:hypothetical protein